MHRFAKILLPLLLPLSLFGQSENCYERDLRRGRELMRLEKYGDAINMFQAIQQTCKDIPADNKLTDLIQLAVRGLERLAENERQAKEKVQQSEAKLARTNQELALAKGKAEENERLALQNADLARERGRRAESLRLVMLAENALREGRGEEALALSFLSIRLAGDEVSPGMLRMFGDAVRGARGREIPLGGTAPVRNLLPVLGGQNRLLVETEDNALAIFDLDSGEKIRLAEASEQPGGAALAADGSLVLHWSGNEAVLFEAGGQIRARLAGHTEAIRFATFSADGKLVLTCGRDNLARLWDARDGRLAAVATGHAGNVYAGGFSPDGALALTRSSDGTARTWDAQGKPLAAFAAGSGYVHAACLLDGGRKIATASADGFARIWSPGGGLLDSFRVSAEPLTEILAFGERGERLALRTADGAAALLDFSPRRLQMLSKNNPASGFAADAAGKMLAVWHADHTLAVHGEKPEATVLNGHKNRLRSAVFSPDGKLLLSTADDRTVKLWGPRSGNLLLDWPIQTTHLVFSPNGRLVVAAETGKSTLAVAPCPDLVLAELKASGFPGDALLKTLSVTYDLLFVGERND